MSACIAMCAFASATQHFQFFLVGQIKAVNGYAELPIQGPHACAQSCGIFVHEAAHCQARCAPGDAALRASDQLRIWRMDSICSRLQATVFSPSAQGQLVCCCYCRPQSAGSAGPCHI